MKKYIVAKLLSLPLLLTILVMSCVDPIYKTCRVDKFYWEDQWHQAYYNSVGRLTQLISDNSKVYFYYDASLRLVKAEIFTTDPTPARRFEFVHGPFGISEIHEYHPSAFGEYHEKIVVTYASLTTIDQLYLQEFLEADPTPVFSGTYTFHYTGGNVSEIDAATTGVATTYRGFTYDKKKNPFKALAASVGNPAFFPVCLFANFPVSIYDISYLSIFSVNNPLTAEYEINGSGLDPEEQTFVTTYAGPFAKKIVWNNSAYGSTSTEDYEFDFKCGFHDHDE